MQHGAVPRKVTCRKAEVEWALLYLVDLEFRILLIRPFLIMVMCNLLRRSIIYILIIYSV